MLNRTFRRIVQHVLIRRHTFLDGGCNSSLGNCPCTLSFGWFSKNESNLTNMHRLQFVFFSENYIRFQLFYGHIHLCIIFKWILPKHLLFFGLIMLFSHLIPDVLLFLIHKFLRAWFSGRNFFFP